jgi:hypothetical protein
MPLGSVISPGNLTPEEMWGVDEALATVLDVR